MSACNALSAMMSSHLVSSTMSADLFPSAPIVHLCRQPQRTQRIVCCLVAGHGHLRAPSLQFRTPCRLQTAWNVLRPPCVLSCPSTRSSSSRNAWPAAPPPARMRLFRRRKRQSCERRQRRKCSRSLLGSVWHSGAPRSRLLRQGVWPLGSLSG